MTVTNESQLRAPNVGVSFYFDKKSWWANVSWSVPQGVNFTGFLIFWDDNTHDVYQQLNQQCRQLPKNVKSILLSEADGTWKYPNTLSILVGILPAYYFKSHQLVMEPFYPPISTTTKPAVALTSSSDDGRCNYKSVGPENTRVLNESEYLAPNIDVTFHEIDNTWLVNTTWSPPEDANFTEYIFYWTSGDIKHKCRLLPKNVTFLVLAEADGIWKYPSEFNVLVVLLPAYNYHSGGPKDGTDYKHFFPPLPSFPTITLEPPRERRMQHGAIVAGVLAGILFIVVLLVLIYKRKTCGASQPHHHIIIPMQDNNNADALTKVNNTSKPQNVDTYFASYLPESEKYSTDVATIAYKLGLMGYKVVFDKVDSVRMNEIGFNMWVDKHILESKKYIVFCSTGYVKLWQSLASSVSSENRFNHVSDQDLVRVRYEIKRISDVYSENCSTSRIICIKMDSKMSTKLLPPWMNHNMLSWPEEKEDIIRRMNDQAAMVMHV